MGPHGGQLGVDSGFVPSAVGLDKLPYFQNSLGRGRSLAGWAVSLRRRRRLLGKGSHTVTYCLWRVTCVSQPQQLSLAVPIRGGATH